MVLLNVYDFGFALGRMSRKARHALQRTPVANTLAPSVELIEGPLDGCRVDWTYTTPVKEFGQTVACSEGHLHVVSGWYELDLSNDTQMPARALFVYEAAV